MTKRKGSKAAPVRNVASNEATQLETDIVSMLKKGGISFYDLTKIQGFNGDKMCGAPSHNVVLWQNVSEEACRVLQRLCEEGRFYPEPTSPLIYYYDGKVLPLPVANKFKKYKTLHWMPV